MRTGMGHGEKGEQPPYTRRTRDSRQWGAREGVGWGEMVQVAVMLETVACCCQCREMGGGGTDTGPERCLILAALNLRNQSLLDWSL